MPSTPTLAELLNIAIENHMVDVHTALPGEIDEYDADTQTCTVTPTVSRAIYGIDDDSKVVEDLPQIQNVPVAFPGTGSVSITWPVSRGDTGLLVFCERNIGQWQETGESGDPGDVSCHSLSGAVFYPGLRHKGNASADTDGSALVIGAGEIKIGSSSASEAAVLGDALKAWLEGHVHSAGTLPSGLTGPPDVTSPNPILGILSSKVTVE